jgi:hypothetical protein
MPQYVIWSEEHGAWWSPGEHGYTRSLQSAGRYAKMRAEVIVEKANAYVTPPAFHEIAIPDPLPTDQVRGLKAHEKG